MKKLNRKGFTLIELLAVIVILAIVLVVTIPSVLRSVDSARNASLQNAANSVADWMTRQYELSALDGFEAVQDNPVDTNFSNYTLKSSAAEAGNMGDALLKAAGLGGGETDATGKAWISGNRVCVELTAVKTGKFNSTKVQKSSGC